jgi:hypothetical protein
VNRTCMLRWKPAAACAVVLIAVAAARTMHAQEIALAPEFSEPTCAVSDQQVVAATERQKVTLATAACSASLRSMVDNTLAEINSLYAAFYEQTQLRCRDAHARANQRDEVVQQILARSLDEQQLQAAHA